MPNLVALPRPLRPCARLPVYNTWVLQSMSKCSEATVFVPNRELPLGYFCSVTPP